MGFLDRLMFWKDDQAEDGTDEFEVSGCFTLPDDPTPDIDPTSIVEDNADGVCAPAVESIGDHLDDGSDHVDGDQAGSEGDHAEA